MTFTADNNGFLALDGTPVRRDIIAGGSAMPTPRAAVLHFTGGADGDGDTNGDRIQDAGSAPDVMRERGLSAHLVVDRDGTVIQCRSFNNTAGHAGVSRWVDPNTGRKHNGCNGFTIGIEIANAGDDAGAQKWAIKNAGAKVEKAAHRNEHGLKAWEVFTDAQIGAVTAICKALVEKYNLDDITGHDCIAPERKLDPGPLFPMQAVREACGFKGLPAVHRP